MFVKQKKKQWWCGNNKVACGNDRYGSVKDKWACMDDV